MIIETQADVTKAVLSELSRARDPRFREIMSAFIRHLHDFAREVKLTEQEFQAATAYINALGKHTNENHNEAVLMAGTLGFSALICLLNNGDHGQTETDASQLGPFWRMNSPLTEEWRLDRALGDAGAGYFCRRLLSRCARQADRGRRSRCLAFLARKASTRIRIRPNRT